MATSDSPGQACQIRTSQATKLAIDKGASVSIHWVPGHTDIPGNEAADRLAKEATKLDPKSYETSYAFLKSKIKAINTQEWQSILD